VIFISYFQFVIFGGFNRFFISSVVSTDPTNKSKIKFEASKSLSKKRSVEKKLLIEQLKNCRKFLKISDFFLCLKRRIK
jgi:hypothetical protein